MKKLATYRSYQRRIKRAYLLLVNQLDQPIDMAALAKEAAFSLYHFHRIYRAMMGETILETHRRLRLSRAAGQLVHLNHSITQIALDAGYETSQAFSKAFKLYFGCTPASYRKLWRSDQPWSCPITDRILYVPIIKELVEMNIKIEILDDFVVYGIRHIGSYAEIGKEFGQLCQWINTSQLQDSVRNYLGIYYDDILVTAPNELRSDACVSFTDAEPSEIETVRKILIKGGRYAIYRHYGPFSMLYQTYDTIYRQWLPGSQYECADAPGFEVYVTDPENTAPEELIIDIYIPLAE